MSSDEQSDKECPLCMEAFDDDINFFPCACQYQICRFCWHRLRTDENGLCPACRQPYPEDPVNFQPLSSAEIQKIKIEKKQKQQQQKNKLSESRKHLSAYRVLQRNLVYVIGLSQRMADADLLKKPEFFGKFGKVLKIAVGTAQNNSNNSQQPSAHTAYVTYTKTDDALRAIQAVNNLVVDGRLIKASLGTTKYCSNFLKGQSCHKNECMYLHEVADDELSFTKEDMQQGKHTECERKLHDQMLSQTKSDQPNSHQHQQTQVFHNSQQPHVNGYSNGSKASRNRNDSQNELDKPPPGFSSKAGTAGITDRMSFDAHEVNKKDTAWNDRTSKNSSSVPTTQSFDQSYANAQVGSGSFESSSSRYVNHVPVAESSSCNGVGFARSYSEANSTVVNNDVYHMTSEASNSDFPSDSKLMMTCDELERILLSSHSVPPGFQRQNSIQNSSTTQNTMHSTREAPVPGTGSFNFFLDLYDDLGFDPFSESSKALADMLLEEEEKTNSTN